jgi:carbon storage regulator
MLVLTRKKDERVVIGPLPDGTVIDVIIVELRGDKVRLGIDAPKNVPVNRQEVFVAKSKEWNLQTLKEQE